MDPYEAHDFTTEVFESMGDTLQYVMDNKPNDLSDADLRFTIFITDFEKLMSYWDTFMLKPSADAATKE